MISKWKPPVKRLWKEINTKFPVTNTEYKSALLIACISFDHFLRLKDRVLEEGETYKTNTGCIKVNPAITLMARERTAYFDAMKRLNLEWSDNETD